MCRLNDASTRTLATTCQISSRPRMPRASAGRKRTIWAAYIMLARSIACISSRRCSIGCDRKIDGHVKTFVRDLHYDLAGRTLGMTDCWANVMPAGTVPPCTSPRPPSSAAPTTCRCRRGSEGAQVRGSASGPPDGRAAASRRCAGGLPLLCQPGYHDGDLVLFESWLRHGCRRPTSPASASRLASTTPVRQKTGR